MAAVLKAVLEDLGPLVATVSEDLGLLEAVVLEKCLSELKVGPFGAGGLGFPINGTFPSLNITLLAINDSFLGFPFPRFPFH